MPWKSHKSYSGYVAHEDRKCRLLQRPGNRRDSVSKPPRHITRLSVQLRGIRYCSECKDKECVECITPVHILMNRERSEQENCPMEAL